VTSVEMWTTARPIASETADQGIQTPTVLSVGAIDGGIQTPTVLSVGAIDRRIRSGAARWPEMEPIETTVVCP